MISANKLRTSAESSTTITLIFGFSKAQPSSKQIHRATRRVARNDSGAATADFLLHQRFRMGMGQSFDHGLAGGWKKDRRIQI